MPLSQGSSENSLHANIKKLIAEGKPRNQAVAIAYKIQEENKKKGDECQAIVNRPPGAPVNGKETGQAFY